MSSNIIKTTFQFKRGLAETWVSLNPILAAGEPGFELDTRKLKIGDGATDWNNLPYLIDRVLIDSIEEICLSLGNEILLLKADKDTEGSVAQIVHSAVAGLIDGAPETLDTLKEIADLIGDESSGLAALLGKINTNEEKIEELRQYTDNLFDSIGSISENHVTDLFSDE